MPLGGKAMTVYTDGNGVVYSGILWCLFYMVGGVAQWLGCRSVAGGLSLICA